MPLARALAFANRVLVIVGMVALLLASLVLTSSVRLALSLQASTDWQDETAVFLLVGATFLSGAFVQSIRGHVGIEAVSDAAVAPRQCLAARRGRPALPVFCALFAWKSWTLLHEAWVESRRRVRRGRPPLWIPYC